MPVRNATLLFLSYGQGPHTHETVYAILSAWRAARSDDRIGLLLYTDDPMFFADLPVEIREVSAEELDRWQGTDGYTHRRKTEVIRDALHRQGHPVAFIDSDTYFRGPAWPIFERIGPGKSVLHLLEGRLLHSNSPAKQALSRHVAETEFTNVAGLPVRIDPNAASWNSGVCGLHPDDAHLLDETLHLIDQLWASHKETHDLEQFALGQVLERHTAIQAADDVVFHYWPTYLRHPWRERLPQLLADTADLPLEERVEALHAERPRPVGKQAVKLMVKRLYRATGRSTPGVRSSAT